MPAPDERALLRLSIAVGAELPAAYVDFVRSHDGAEPDDNSFPVGADNESGVRRFIPVAVASLLVNEVDGFPAGAIPLAEDGCGNLVYLAPRTGEIFFWSHEVEGPDRPLADGLAKFLEGLKPFDASAVQLAPGQVKSVWIDPDFLATLKKSGEA